MSQNVIVKDSLIVIAIIIVSGLILGSGVSNIEMPSFSFGGGIESEIDTVALKNAELGEVGDQSVTYQDGEVDSILLEHGIVATEIKFVEEGKDLQFSVDSYNLEPIKVGFSLYIEFWETPDTMIIHLQEEVIPAGGSAEYSILETLRARDSFVENEMTVKGFTIEPWYEGIAKE